MIPALASDTVYFTKASWRMDLAKADFLSNSSMQHAPRSDSTSASDSSTKSSVSGSRET
jgi:hypothetical protein